MLNVVQRIINVVPDSEWIYAAGNIGYEGIGIFPNKNLKDMCGSGWNAPDVNGTFVSIVENDFLLQVMVQCIKLHMRQVRQCIDTMIIGIDSPLQAN